MWNPKNGNFYALELKTTKETSLTYWQKEFEEAGKDKKFMIILSWNYNLSYM